jgi:PTH1 family peptidyl-tRNA hydrolase
MKLIIGLGNPGSKYEKTRHNIGFMCLDYYNNNELKESFRFERKFNAEIIKKNNYILAKPQTFMNLSGNSVKNIVDYYDIAVGDILIIYDDFSLPLSKLRLREKGGSGGHNGIKSIIERLGTQEFKRVKIGIDNNPIIDPKDYVLSNFSKNELDEVIVAAKQVQEIINLFVKDYAFSQIMNQFN